MATSPFASFEVLDPPEAFQQTALYENCRAKLKVNLSLGAYRTEDGLPWVLPVVDKVQRHLTSSSSQNFDYAPMQGIPEFNETVLRLIFGAGHLVLKENRVIGYQSIGGNGSLGLSFSLLRGLRYKDLLIPTRTYENHPHLADFWGFTTIKYRYLDKITQNLDFNGMLADLKAAPDYAVVVIQAAAHNPTGLDPSREQWKHIEEVCKEKNFFVLFDSAYQGFASGDVDQDAWAVRYFAEKGRDMIVANTFSKNFGLYNQRVGLVAVVASDSKFLPGIKSDLVMRARAMVGTPPAHGAKIVATILSNIEYREEWKIQLKSMTDRMKKMRRELVECLRALNTPGDWDHLSRQIGMFSIIDLSAEQVDYMRSKNVYLLSNGRISIPGLNSENVQYVAKCLDQAVRLLPKTVEN